MNRFIVVAFLLLLASCDQKKGADIPENILPPAKMTDILVDVNILEASMGLNVISDRDTLHKDTSLFYDIFNTHRITRLQYNESMDFYMSHPELLDQIYDSVLFRFDVEKNRLAK